MSLSEGFTRSSAETWKNRGGAYAFGVTSPYTQADWTLVIEVIDIDIRVARVLLKSRAQVVASLCEVEGVPFEELKRSVGEITNTLGRIEELQRMRKNAENQRGYAAVSQVVPSVPEESS